jgi:hypothetical protein
MSKERISLTIDGIMSMRSKDLRNILIQSFHQDRDYILSIIDRNELRDLAIKLFVIQNSKDQQYAFMYQAGVLAVILLVSVIVILNLNIIRNFISNLTRKRLWKMLKSTFYKQRKRFKMMVFSFNEQAYMTSLVFLLATILEIYYALIQLTALLSWVIPSHIYYYRYRLPSLSMPLSTSMLLPANTRNEHQGFGLDIGPMVTTWILIWLVSQLDNYGAAGMSKVMMEKDKATWSSRPSSTRMKMSRDNEDKAVRQSDIDACSGIQTQDKAHGQRAADGELTQEEIDFILQSEMSLQAGEREREQGESKPMKEDNLD